MTTADLTASTSSFLIVAGEPEYAEELAGERAADLRLLPTFRKLLAAPQEQLGVAVDQLVTRILRLPPPIGVLSLARGGIPIGTLLVRMAARLGIPAEHGVLGWVRGETGPLNEDFLPGECGSLVLVDGWTGTGDSIREVHERWTGGAMLTAALSDPAGVCDIAGTNEDVLCPHAMMHSVLNEGLGRVRRHTSGLLVAPRDDRYADGLLEEYHFGLLEQARRATSRVRAFSSRLQHEHADRSRSRIGINECWRASVRGELGELVVNPRFREELDVALLVDRQRGPVRERDLGALRCACSIRTAPSPRMAMRSSPHP
ncbi:hypothetical protein M8542_30680 [Amycolatopsis sp. OK19-0408]|uniref:Cysteine protease StiP N-terminal domain-containing protein n=1 Tax=Amycolatopsis iheyensis TaxID=2945988 RepID=A0A9X2NIC0_9PSEU|nr:cysteine protease StiP domain-containing protein [Amycolatopsis iheyensis]MCR6487204.1 hypothetical protein [Amycolatopsis iheyensis]